MITQENRREEEGGARKARRRKKQRNYHWTTKRLCYRDFDRFTMNTLAISIRVRTSRRKIGGEKLTPTFFPFLFSPLFFPLFFSLSPPPFFLFFLFFSFFFESAANGESRIVRAQHHPIIGRAATVISNDAFIGILSNARVRH